VLHEIQDVVQDSIKVENQWIASHHWKSVKIKDYSNIKQSILSNRDIQLAVFPSYSVFSNIVANLLTEWEEPATELVVKYSEALSQITKQASVYAGAPKNVQAFIFGLVSSILTDLEPSVSDQVQNEITKEKTPYTQGKEIFRILNQLRVQPILKTLKEVAIDGKLNFQTVKSVLTRNGVGEHNNQDCEAIEIENAVMAYLEISKKRVCDTIPMLLEDKLVNVYFEALIVQLTSLSDEQLESLLFESEATSKLRKNLQQELSALLKSQSGINF
jgi:hypothetical protein